MSNDIESLIHSCDVRAFAFIPSQTSNADRVALLELQNHVAAARGSYVYMETGSYLGGTLATHCGDRRCRKVYSIDARVAITPNEHGGPCSDYGPQSSAAMLDRLRKMPDVDVEKVVTFDCDARDVEQGSVVDTVDLLLIDGEHTDSAVESDFFQCRRFCSADTIVAFHDYSCVRRGVRKILRRLVQERIRVFGVKLGGDVFAIFPCGWTEFSSTYLREHFGRRHSFAAREFARDCLPAYAVTALSGLLRRFSGIAR